MLSQTVEYPSTKAAKEATGTESRSVVMTSDDLKELLANLPAFQRPLKRNQKTREMAATIARTETIPGMVTLGVIGGRKYLVDGQHRVTCAVDSGLELVNVEIRQKRFDSMEAMADEFRYLNSVLTPMRPDDILRALSETSPILQYIREHAPFVGYGNVRRGGNHTVLSMSVLVKTWTGSATEAPAPHGTKAPDLVATMPPEEAAECVRFLKLASEAWGREDENKRLWGTLNMILCMWLFRRLVLDRRPRKSAVLDLALFKKCLYSVAADKEYADWLVGRNLSERDRAPAYARLKVIFAKRISSETGQKAVLPQPYWSSK